MQLPYFFEPEIIETLKTFTLSEDTSKHCAQVLRMRKGEQLQLTNGKGLLITAAITLADKRHSEVSIDRVEKYLQAKRKISLCVSLLKNNTRFEWFLEKATEIGVSEITPLTCKHTERQHFRFDRMQNILVSAMLQSRQVWLPVLHKPTAFLKVVESANETQKLIAHCYDTEKKMLNQLPLGDNILLLTGPEGDFSIEEVSAALAKGFVPVSLGNTRLRSETANIVAAVMLRNY